MIFAVLKANADKTFSFYTATVGPMSCLLIDKRQSPIGTYNSMFTQANNVILAQDVNERERVFSAGGEIREEDDFRVYAKG